MRDRAYPPGALHEIVLQFLVLHCKHASSLEDFAKEHKKKNPNDHYRIEALKIGLVSKQQLVDYLFEVSGGHGVSVGNPLAKIYDTLVRWDVFVDIPFSDHALFDFKINYEAVSYYQSRQVLDNIVKGPVSLLPKYRGATAAIVVSRHGHESVGTGSLVRHHGCDVLLTNRHVVNPKEGVVVKEILVGNARLAVSSADIAICESDDLAGIRIASEEGARFFLGDSGNVLEEVILLGYPKIPLTAGPHLTAHSGEINAIIRTRCDEELYLISNYASPGSSAFTFQLTRTSPPRSPSLSAWSISTPLTLEGLDRAMRELVR